MTIMQELDRYYGRMEQRGDVVAPGWSREPIAMVLELAVDGTLLGAAPHLDGRGKPRVETVPKWFTRSGSGSTPFFLWDNGAYALGLGSKDPAKTARDHDAFRDLHLRELYNEPDPGLAALRVFLVGWVPDRNRLPRLDEKLLDRSVAFRLEGGTRLLHQTPAARAHVERLRTAAVATEIQGFCLVRGVRLPLVRLHPKIKGIDGTSAAEVPLVSFNVDAFTSYAKEQGYNAPTSQEAAFRYGAALNALLDRAGRNRMRVGDSTVAFWADATALGPQRSEAAAAAAEDYFAADFGGAPPTKPSDRDVDSKQATQIGEALAEVARGQPLTRPSPDLLPGVRFHVLALAPNAARLQVRVWISNDFTRFAQALKEHREAIALDPPPWGNRPPSVNYLLLRTTALAGEQKNIPDGLVDAVLGAVLGCTRYPRTWLAATILRLRAGDNPGTGWHASAVKACLHRMQPKESPPVSLTPNETNHAYQLGRLFAVLEAAQREDLGKNVNATIADRYYGSASATPALVFGALLRNARNHISSATKRDKGFWLEPRLEEIISRLPSELPRTLRLEDQGRFAIGYYHERAHRAVRSSADNTSPNLEK